jgi:hypothetical protein
VDRRVNKIMANFKRKYSYSRDDGRDEPFYAYWELSKKVPEGWISENEKRIFSPEAYEGYPKGFEHSLSTHGPLKLVYQGWGPAKSSDLEQAIKVFCEKFPDVVDEDAVQKYGNTNNMHYEIKGWNESMTNKEFSNIYKMKESEDSISLKLAYGIAQMAIEDIKFLYDEDPDTLESHGYDLDEMEKAMALFAKLSSNL